MLVLFASVVISGLLILAQSLVIYLGSPIEWQAYVIGGTKAASCSIPWNIGSPLPKSGDTNPFTT
jgi:hypothetical protein